MKYKDSEEKKWHDHNMNQMCDNLEKSSKVPFVTTPTPERGVEEIVEELRNKILDIETAVRLTYNEKDSDQMIDKLLTHYTQALQAERQKREEAIALAEKRGAEAERERIINLAGGEPYIYVPEITNEDTSS